MDVNILLANNPFFEAYFESDLLGKLIFIGLYALSICSWIVLLQKIWLTHQAKKNAFRFYESFHLHRSNPLQLEFESLVQKKEANPFLDLYKVLKKHSLELLAKNRHFSNQEEKKIITLSINDIDFVSAHLAMQTAAQVKKLEKNLYLLSTTYSLAPFLGLLGTVWGILTTFGHMQAQQGGGGHQMVLSGLSLALATTVLGLIDAIPALIGYNYLKNSIRDFTFDMEGFSNDLLAAVELQYRKVDAA
ncbi:MAG: MotA/TolQ/ExbB proton channel family protein [Parachlamydia sp.]|jgi:biopolymer transport protein TolQ|nr:MotA/TolQ/ExbB proton channel family protein [Parachlamydia sp.]